MKIVFSFTFTIAFLTSALSQNIVFISKGCGFHRELKSIPIEIKELESPWIQDQLNEILEAAKLKQNFSVYYFKGDDVISTRINGERSILIDTSFLIEQNELNPFSSYIALSHAIAHHLNNKIDSALDWWDEINADEYAGNILYALRKPKKAVTDIYASFISPLLLNGHLPETQAREKAIVNGYCNGYYRELSLKLPNLKKINYSIREEEQILENLLNDWKYDKYDFIRNINYSVSNDTVHIKYESSYYGGRQNDTYITIKEYFKISNITSIYLRWHDPGEIAFKTKDNNNIETLQSPEGVKHLNPNFYFDDHFTISEDFEYLLKIIDAITKIQDLNKRDLKPNKKAIS